MKILNWTITRDVEERARVYSISDPAFAEYLGISGFNLDTLVTEEKALGITAYWRAVNIIAGTIAGLPLKTYKRVGEGKERVTSFFDNPAGPYPLSPFAWKELLMFHLLNQGEAFLLHVYNNAGVLIGLWPVHPNAVSVEWVGYEKQFKVTNGDNEEKVFKQHEMTHIMGPTLDGTRGMGALSIFRQMIKTGLSADAVAYKNFANGFLIAGIATTVDEDVDETEAKVIKAGLNAKLRGIENAGDIAFVNRNIKFTPWTMSNEDAQFLESREFQVTEFARMFGIPPHLLAQTEKQTSWGTGVAEQNLGLARYTLMGWTTRIEEPLSELLQKSRFVEFDYKGLLQGTPTEEIELLIKQVEAGLLTADEARALLNRPPLPKGVVASGTTE